MPSFSAPLLAVIGHVQRAAAVLAHQGGWDEFLMVAAPVGIFAALLFSANRRAARLQQQLDERSEGETRPDGSPAERRHAEEPRNEHRGPI
jgi:hypothetical protein